MHGGVLTSSPASQAVNDARAHYMTIPLSWSATMPQRLRFLVCGLMHFKYLIKPQRDVG
jgi:hypothetical protein